MVRVVTMEQVSLDEWSEKSRRMKEKDSDEADGMKQWFQSQNDALLNLVTRTAVIADNNANTTQSKSSQVLLFTS